MKDISNENLFSNADDLLILERKYGDFLTEEDLTGIKKIVKIKIRKNKINLEDFNLKIINKNKKNDNFFRENNKNNQDNEEENSNYINEKNLIKSKIDSHNYIFDKKKKKRMKFQFSFSQRMIKIKNHLSMLQKKIIMLVL